MDFHGIESSFISESLSSADLLPLPFAKPRSARSARRAGLRSAPRGAIRHRKFKIGIREYEVVLFGKPLLALHFMGGPQENFLVRTALSPG